MNEKTEQQKERKKRDLRIIDTIIDKYLAPVLESETENTRTGAHATFLNIREKYSEQKGRQHLYLNDLNANVLLMQQRYFPKVSTVTLCAS